MRLTGESAPRCVLAAVVALAFPLLVNNYWLSVGITRSVLRHRRRKLGAAGRLRRPVLLRPDGLRLDRAPTPRACWRSIFGRADPARHHGRHRALRASPAAASAMSACACAAPISRCSPSPSPRCCGIILVSEDEVTGGNGGLEMPPLFHTRSDAPYYYLFLVLLAASFEADGPAGASRWGLFFRAIRENEDAAAAAGVKVVRFRLLAFIDRRRASPAWPAASSAITSPFSRPISARSIRWDWSSPWR